MKLKKNYTMNANKIGHRKITSLILINCFLISQAFAQLVNIPVTGYNNDVVANGVGSNSIPGTSYPNIGMDGARYTYIDNTFKYTAANALPTCYMPSNRLAPSLRTPGLTYTFQNYTGFNAMTIDNDNTAYLTSPFAKTGTITLTTPGSYSKLFVLYESVMNVSPMAVDALVTFTDATTQSFNSLSCVNWFTATLPAYNAMGRTMPSGVPQCGTSPSFFPNMFELQLTLSPGNTTKQVQSITFTLPANYTTGSTPDKVNYFHVMALGGQIAPLGFSTLNSSTTNISIYPNPASETIRFENTGIETVNNLILFDLSGREILNLELKNKMEEISIAELKKGIYIYEVYSNFEMQKVGKLLIK